jgi:beta-galactosidase
MRRWLTHFLTSILILPLAWVAGEAQNSAPPPGAVLPNVLYGAAYYNEYMPADLQPGRLEKDVALMTEAGISVVRMGESTWSLWEPADGRLRFTFPMMPYPRRSRTMFTVAAMC